MKKLSIIILMLIMFLPVHVFGACGGTGLFWFETDPTQYYAYVSNKNGAKAICYKNFTEKETCGEIIVPYLSKIKTIDEVFIDGKLYVEFYYDDNSYNSYYINLDDIKVADGNFGDFEYYSSKVLTYKDIYLHAGPAFAYDKVVKVPANTELKIKIVELVPDDEFENSPLQWAYTEYDGKKGWVYFYSHLYATQPNDYSGCLEDGRYTYGEHNYYLRDDLKLVDSPFSNDKVVGIIPKGSHIKLRYFLNSNMGISSYIEYNGIKGWINKIGEKIYDKDGIEIMVNKGGYIFSLEELNIYSDVHKTKVIGKVPKYTEVDLNYAALDKEEDMVYMNFNYNDIEGFIIEEFRGDTHLPDFAFHYNECPPTYFSYKLIKDIELKNKNTNKIETIKKDEIIYISDLNGAFEVYFEDFPKNYSEEYVVFYNENVYLFEEDFDWSDYVKLPYSEENSDSLDEEDDITEDRGTFKISFDVVVPEEVKNAKIFGSVATESDDAISTMQDDALLTDDDNKNDNKNKNDSNLKTYVIYTCIGLVILLIIVIIIIIMKKKKCSDSKTPIENITTNIDTINDNVENNNSTEINNIQENNMTNNEVISENNENNNIQESVITSNIEEKKDETQL